MIAVALVLSISAVAPLMALIFWPRASALDALVALVTGLAATEAAMIVMGGVVTSAHLAGASLIGAAAGIAAGFVSSIVRGGDRQQGASFVRTMLHGRTEMPNFDRGA
jgi:hypothetical protein